MSTFNRLSLKNIDIVLISEQLLPIPNSTSKRKVYAILKATFRDTGAFLSQHEIDHVNETGGMALFKECQRIINMINCGCLDDDNLEALRSLMQYVPDVHINDKISELYADFEGVDIMLDECEIGYRLHGFFRV